MNKSDADKMTCSTCAHNTPSGCGFTFGFSADCLSVAPAKFYTRVAKVQPSAKEECSTTPIGSAFAANSGRIMSSIEQAAAASAAKMGDDASKLFSIETRTLTKQMQKAAKAPAKVEANKDNGSNGSYYEVDCVSHKDGREYMVECQDIIDALQMTFNEGNTFKSLWRLAAARLGKVKGDGGKELYDAQKVAFYGKRVLKAQEAKQ